MVAIHMIYREVWHGIVAQKSHTAATDPCACSWLLAMTNSYLLFVWYVISILAMVANILITVSDQGPSVSNQVRTKTQ